MIFEYEEKYAEEVKDLLVELQEHIVNIDKEKYNKITPPYRELYFSKTLDEVKKYDGKIFLYKENDHIVGLIVGIYTFTYIMSYLIKRYHDNVYSFILGISISSILLLFLETFTYNYSLLQIIISIFLLVTGYIISKKCI